MDRKSRYKWHILTALLVCFFLFIIQGRVFQQLEFMKARLVSPNYLDITMIRLQRIHKLQGDSIIMGSSITERLMSSTQTAVLGVPSSSFTAGLKLMEEVVTFPAGTTYILETNNMFNGIYAPVLNDATDWFFHFTRDSRHFSIAAKPTNLLLSSIYHIISKKGQSSPAGNHYRPEIRPEDLGSIPSPSPSELEEWREIISGINEIKRMGGKICFVQFPTRNPHEFDSSYKKACKLARHLQIPVLNYNTEEWRQSLVFTDSRHLNSRDPNTGILRETMARDAKACTR